MPIVCVMGLTWWVGSSGEGCASGSFETLLKMTCTLLSVLLLLDALSSLISLFMLVKDSLLMFMLMVVLVSRGTGEGRGDEA